VAGCVAVVALYGASREAVETDVILWFPKDHKIRQDYDFIRERLSGISPINIVVTSTSDSSVATPATVLALEDFATYLQSRPGVGKVVSLADPILQLHEGLSGELPAEASLTADLIDQYLLILESKEQMSDLITSDRRRTNILVRADDNGSDRLLAIADEAEGWWAVNGPDNTQGRATGIMFEFARSEDAIANGQIRGLALALAVIAVVLLAVFGSAKLAALALVPNALPVAAVFGFMGFVGIPLDAGTVLLGNLALGIAVDDTIHVVNGFQMRRRIGREPVSALIETMRAILPALVYTTVAVGMGFLVLGLSTFTFTRDLGLLTSSVMVLCLLADVMLLPSLLVGGGGGQRGLKPSPRMVDSPADGVRAGSCQRVPGLPEPDRE
jgi:predicted RND superfamily exporter protein